MANKSSDVVSTIAQIATSGESPRYPTFSKSGKCFFVSDFNSASISSYSINSQTGELSNTGLAITGSAPENIAISNDGNFAYTPNFGGDNTISMYSVNETNCTLTPLSKSTISTATDNSQYGKNPWAASITPNGKYLYAANLYTNSMANGSSIIQFSINPTNGELNYLSESMVLINAINPSKVVFDKSGDFAYLVAQNKQSAPVFLMYKIKKNGELEPLATPSIDLNGISGQSAIINLDKSGNYFYLNESNTISVYKKASNGILSKVGATALENSDPTHPLTITNIQFSLDGQFIYVLNPWDQQVYAYKVNSETGLLSLAGVLPASGGTPKNILIAK